MYQGCSPRVLHARRLQSGSELHVLYYYLSNLHIPKFTWRVQFLMNSCPIYSVPTLITSPVTELIIMSDMVFIIWQSTISEWSLFIVHLSKWDTPFLFNLYHLLNIHIPIFHRNNCMLCYSEFLCVLNVMLLELLEYMVYKRE